jgi:2-methylcitrate dehydratase PrpD
MSAPVNSYLQPSAIVGSNATLASALVVNTTYTSLTVTAVATAYATGANITLLSGTSSQTVTTSAPVAVGATTIAVTSFTANFAYPVGTYVDPTYTPERSKDIVYWNL